METIDHHTTKLKFFYTFLTEMFTTNNWFGYQFIKYKPHNEIKEVFLVVSIISL